MNQEEALHKAKSLAGTKDHVYVPELAMKFGIEEYADMIYKASISSKEDSKSHAIKKAEKLTERASEPVNEITESVRQAMGLSKEQMDSINQGMESQRQVEIQKAKQAIEEAYNNA